MRQKIAALRSNLGEAGQGKSALLRNVLQTVQASGGGGTAPVRVLMAQSSAMVSECVPLHTCRQWLHRWHGPQRLPKLLDEIRSVEGEAGAMESLKPALASLLGAGGGGTGTAAASMDQKTEALAEAVLGLSRARPLILCIEDAEHLDSASRDVVERIVQRIHERGHGMQLFVLVAQQARQRAADAGVVEDALQRGHARGVVAPLAAAGPCPPARGRRPAAGSPRGAAPRLATGRTESCKDAPYIIFN